MYWLLPCAVKLLAEGCTEVDMFMLMGGQSRRIGVEDGGVFGAAQALCALSG